MLTERQLAFAKLMIDAKVNDKPVSVHKFALEAGYSAHYAQSRSYELTRNQPLMDYIDRQVNVSKMTGQTSLADGIMEGMDLSLVQLAAQHQADLLANGPITDPKQALILLMNFSDLKTAADCAKALMPYDHVRKGDIGKKKEQENKAAETRQASAFKPRVVS